MAQPVSETRKNLLIIGGSTAGMNTAHYLLKHVIPDLLNSADYHVTLVDPAKAWFNRVQAPRGVISEEKMAIDKFMLPIEDGFKSYPKESFTFVQGKAVSMDHNSRTVTVEQIQGGSTTYNYYALFICSGAASPSPLLGTQGDHVHSVEAIKAFREKLPSVKSIVIAGGGPAAVETAGELGEHLNGTPGMFQTRPKEVKTKITIVTADKKLLPVLRPALAKQAEKLLNRVGVDVVYESKVESTSPERAGKLAEDFSLGDLLSPTTVTLSNGTTLEADLYIPAIGLKPNTEWVPKELLDARGKVDTNKTTLRVEKAGPRVYAYGDVGNYGSGGLMEVMMRSTPVVMINVKRDLLHASKAEGEEPASTGKDKEFVNDLGESQLVPIGPSGGVGAVFGWKMPGAMVKMIKGKTFFVENNPKTVTGEAVKNEFKWKFL